MKSMQKPIRTIVSAAIIAAMTAGLSHAGSFSLYTESNGSAVGNYAAGIAAEAADASTGWYNPAGLALIHQQQAIAGVVGVFPVSKLSGTSTFTTLGLPSYIQSFSGYDGAKDAAVPSFHYALPLGENAAFGLSVVAPFGLSTEWDEGGPVRYAGTASDLITTNLSPEIGGRIAEHLALGLGLDLQYADVKFNRMLGAPALLQAFDLAPNFLDSESYNKGHSFAVGFHAGILALFNEDHTRIGFNYQSQMKHKFNGYSRLTGPLANVGLDITDPDALFALNPSASARVNNLSSNDIDLPSIATLSAYQDVNERFALLGSIVYTGWHSLNAIALNNVLAFSPTTGSQVTVNSVSSENYNNAWRFALGANYHVNEQWMLRVGGGYDETPTNNHDRSVRVPDADRWALAIGTHYQMKPFLGLDLGYTYLFSASDPSVNRTDIVGTTSSYNVNARVKAHANLVGAQLTWTIDPVVPMTK